MQHEGEKGYPWLSFSPSKAWVISSLTVLLVCIIGSVVYFWESHYGNDPSPDGIVGLIYAVAGTICIAFAAVLYTVCRRAHQRAIGQLNTSLQWHIAFGVMGLVLLFMHSFGNFNPRSGTYALYSMIALVISGFIGRTLDRLIPRLIAQEARKALTTQGEDRIESISQKLQDIVVHNSQELQSFPTTTGASARSLVPKKSGAEAMEMLRSAADIASNGKNGHTLQTSWDMAYISLEETPQEVARDAPQYRFVPDRKSALARPGALIPGAQEHYSELEDVQHALQREQFYRYIIRYWRIFHVGLVLLTMGLTIWHLVYAAQLWLPVVFHL